LRLDAVAASAPRTAPARHYEFADALRALAILAVIVHHFAYFTHPTVFRHDRSLEFLGVWGVNCFFVLSGFLLARPYMQSILEPRRRFPSTRMFLLRRFLRIYPMYALSLVLSVFAVAINGQGLVSARDLMAHLVFAHTLFTAFSTSMNGPLWTMSVDADFYILLPIVGWIGFRLLRVVPTANRVLGIAAILSALAIASIVYRALAIHLHPDAIGGFDVSTVYVRNVLGMASSFCLGSALALHDLTRGPRPVPRAWVISAACAALVLLIALSRITADSFIAYLCFDLIAAMSCACFLFVLAAVPSFRAVTSNSSVTFLATAAYGAYLFHWLVLETVDRDFGMPIGSKAFVLIGSISLVITFALAAVAFRVVERPFLSIKERSREV
jgi:peptidoglycan/LPS O-acetylase OafA/YrhL